MGIDRVYKISHSPCYNGGEDEMRKYWRLFQLSVQNSLQARSRIVVYILLDLVVPAASILLWIGAYRYSGGIASGWALSELIRYYLTVSFFSLTLSHYVELTIGYRHIADGNLGTFLLKPIPYLSYIFVDEMGWKTVRILLSLIPYGLLFVAFRPYLETTGQPSPSWIGILFFSLISYFISFFYKSLLGFSAFWVTQINGVVNLFWVLQALFSGMLVPLDFLPSIIKEIAGILPFQYMYYIPAKVFLEGRSLSSYLGHMTIALLWLSGLLVLTGRLFRHGLLRFTDIRG